MKRNCNLELKLVTPSVFPEDFSFTQSPSVSNHDTRIHQLTIFYNGRVAASDVTELQARAIISLANRHMEEQKVSPSPRSGPMSPLLNSPMYSPSPSPTSGLSMTRSLQNFLQNRKSRIQATSPYPLLTPRHKNHHPNAS